jgi:hypothetical protein
MVAASTTHLEHVVVLEVDRRGLHDYRGLALRLQLRVERLQALLYQAELVVVVVNDEMGVDADGLTVATQETGADGVKGSQRQSRRVLSN